MSWVRKKDKKKQTTPNKCCNIYECNIYKKEAKIYYLNFSKDLKTFAYILNYRF